MQSIDASHLRELLPWDVLVESLREMFREGCETPVRHHHQIAVPGEPEATLLLMPAWRSGAYIGVKIINAFPGNSARGQPAISGIYLLSDATDGRLLAQMDGGELTARRTPAASALAADYLARKDASQLLVVGTGRLAPQLARAHAAVRPIQRVSVWGRSVEKAVAVVGELADEGFEAQPVDDLAAAVADADIVSCATLSTEPLVDGDWLSPGTHLDLVGAFRPNMREANDRAIQRSCVFVDTRAGATSEGGDIVIPLQTGVLAEDDIVADLYDLCRGTNPGRTSDDEITLFKSVGASLEDLAAAITAWERLSA